MCTNYGYPEDVKPASVDSVHDLALCHAELITGASASRDMVKQHDDSPERRAPTTKRGDQDEQNTGFIQRDNVAMHNAG